MPLMSSNSIAVLLTDTFLTISVKVCSSKYVNGGSEANIFSIFLVLFKVSSTFLLIPANAANPTLAKAFVQIMLTDPVVQLNSLYKGFSVQRDVENAYLAQTIADGEQTYAADPLTCDWDSLIEELGAPSVSSATIYDVTHEAAFDYYGNEIDLDTAVQRIEENLGLYFSEQQ